jgi:hypothetical protein
VLKTIAMIKKARFERSVIGKSEKESKKKVSF